MPNRTEVRPAKAVLRYATGSLPLLRLFSTPLKMPGTGILSAIAWFKLANSDTQWLHHSKPS